jgi:hypothetical protein
LEGPSKTTKVLRILVASAEVRTAQPNITTTPTWLGETSLCYFNVKEFSGHYHAGIVINTRSDQVLPEYSQMFLRKKSEVTMLISIYLYSCGVVCSALKMDAAGSFEALTNV